MGETWLDGRRQVEANFYKRAVAQIDVSFSNSLIEAWWRSLEHRWLFLHQLDNIATVKRLAEFYVTEHNQRRAVQTRLELAHRVGTPRIERDRVNRWHSGREIRWTRWRVRLRLGARVPGVGVASERHVVVGLSGEGAAAVGADGIVELDDGGVELVGEVVLQRLAVGGDVRMCYGERSTDGGGGGAQHVDDGELGRIAESRAFVRQSSTLAGGAHRRRSREDVEVEFVVEARQLALGGDGEQLVGEVEHDAIVSHGCSASVILSSEVMS